MYDTYEKAMVETKEILQYFDKNLLNKIPNSLIEKINSFESDNYVFKVDKSKKLSEQNICKETKEYISSIFIKYCCNEEDKESLLEKCAENDIKIQKEFQEKYSYDNLFKNKEEAKKNNEESSTSLTVIENKNWFVKVIEKFKSIFRKNRKEV